MTAYRVSPDGVNRTVAKVRAEAAELGSTLDAVWADVPAASGGSGTVADALAGFVEAGQEDMKAVAERLEQAPGAMVRAVAAFIEGDEEMATTHRGAMSQTESGPSAPQWQPPDALAPPDPLSLRGGDGDPFRVRFGKAGA